MTLCGSEIEKNTRFWRCRKTFVSGAFVIAPRRYSFYTHRLSSGYGDAVSVLSDRRQASSSSSISYTLSSLAFVVRTARGNGGHFAIRRCNKTSRRQCAVVPPGCTAHSETFHLWRDRLRYFRLPCPSLPRGPGRRAPLFRLSSVPRGNGERAFLSAGHPGLVAPRGQDRVVVVAATFRPVLLFLKRDTDSGPNLFLSLSSPSVVIRVVYRRRLRPVRMMNREPVDYRFLLCRVCPFNCRPKRPDGGGQTV